MTIIFCDLNDLLNALIAFLFTRTCVVRNRDYLLALDLKSDEARGVYLIGNESFQTTKCRIWRPFPVRTSITSLRTLYPRHMIKQSMSSQAIA